MDRDQIVGFYQAFFQIKEQVSLALFQLESNDPDDRSSALMNLDRALNLAAQNAQLMRGLIPPLEPPASSGAPE